MTKSQMIEKCYKEIVKANAFTIPVSVTLAQAILESGWFESYLTVNGNNLFGIKWNGKGQFLECDTKEYVNGKYISVKAKFKSYGSWSESIKDHDDLFNRLDRYKPLRGETDAFKACDLLQSCGYATSPIYSNSLKNIIKLNDLKKYDNCGVGLFMCKIQGISVGDIEEFVDLVKQLDLGKYSKFDVEFFNISNGDVLAVEKIVEDKKLKSYYTKE